VVAAKEHLASLPSLQADGMLEEPSRILLPMAAQVETLDAAQLDSDTILAFERSLSRLSDAVADRYFLHGANAVPTARPAALA
jgi:hypothetical protein